MFTKWRDGLEIKDWTISRATGIAKRYATQEEAAQVDVQTAIEEVKAMRNNAGRAAQPLDCAIRLSQMNDRMNEVIEHLPKSDDDAFLSNYEHLQGLHFTITALLAKYETRYNRLTSVTSTEHNMKGAA